MRTLLYRYQRRNRKRIIVSLLVFLLAIAFVSGYYLRSGQRNHLPLGVIFLSQLCYGGNVDEMKSYRDALPVFAESEAMTEGGLMRWEISEYRDERTGAMIPVFYGETASKGGLTAAVGSSLIQMPASRRVALEEIKPQTTEVLIYCTHTSESFDGKKDANGRGEVLTVAHHLADELENRGIGAVVSDTVHDSPDWFQSYANSKITAASLLESYPEAKLLIDLHRDSGLTRADSVVDINGKAAASLLLVVGSNAKLEHPRWEENYATAKAVGTSVDKVNPGLLRGVRVQKGRYNQHLTTNAILLEVGTDLNTLAEAEYSVEMVAEALQDYLINLE